MGTKFQKPTDWPQAPPRPARWGLPPPPAAQASPPDPTPHPCGGGCCRVGVSGAE